MTDAEILYSWDGPPRVRLLRREAETPGGVRYPAHWLEVGDGSTGVVAVAHDGENALFVVSPRPAAGETLLELPRGFGRRQDGKDPVDAAAADAMRELVEETGYDGSQPHVLGAYVVDSSVYPQRVAVVELRVDRDQEPTAPDGETAGSRWIRWRDIGGILARGEVRDAHTLSALALVAARWAR